MSDWKPTGFWQRVIVRFFGGDWGIGMWNLLVHDQGLSLSHGARLKWEWRT